MQTKEERKAYLRRYRTERAQEIDAYNRQYRASHREEAARYRAEHVAERVVYDKQYRAAHKAEIAKIGERYYAEHTEYVLARSRGYYIEHQEQVKNTVAIWRTANKERCREYTARRRAYKRGVESKMIQGQWNEMLREFNHRCAYCLVELTESNTTMDHMTPLCKGGRHEAANIVPCCKSCNSKKNSKTLLEFLWGREFIPRMSAREP